ncbi:hypothetical protein [Xylophilus sp.]|uniref:hypothetical protein n=1 Tax=Xylophilus sp. TaxID=2653893 RepID=UPI0013BD1205|nr:hypothetical protein [Xylophilus sp.]KAF1048692.1 MAG: hypothetical protein GAK38_01136 [Xylophilus sp.]
MRSFASPGSLRFVWGMPLLLAVLTAFGLVAALLGTGVWHGAAWLAMAVPVGVGLRCSLRRPPRPRA